MKSNDLITAERVHIKRSRQLPFRGEVLVKFGENVHPEDMVARTSLGSRVRVLDIAKGLGVEPSEVESCLVRQVGEQLEAGDVLAQFEGAITRVVRMPTVGTFIAYQDGKAFLSTDTISISVKAGMIGRVEEVTPGFGVVISTKGSLFQGVWGNERVGSGVLTVLPLEIDQEPFEAVENLVKKGQVVASHSCQSRQSLTSFVQKEVTGLILGSMNPDLIPEVMRLTFPVILLQGFGVVNLDPIRLKLLQDRDGSVVCINASMKDTFSETPPEVIIPQVEGNLEDIPDINELAVTQCVQINSGEYFGKIGTVEALPEEMETFQSDIVDRSAVVKIMDTGDKVIVPQRNLRVINGI